MSWPDARADCQEMSTASCTVSLLSVAKMAEVAVELGDTNGKNYRIFAKRKKNGWKGEDGM